MAPRYDILNKISNGEASAAIRELRQILQNNPSDIEAWSLLAHAMSDPARKKDCYQQILRIDPDNQHAQERLQALEASRQTSQPAPALPLANISASSYPPSAQLGPPVQVEATIACPYCTANQPASAATCSCCGGNLGEYTNRATPQFEQGASSSDVVQNLGTARGQNSTQGSSAVRSNRAHPKTKPTHSEDPLTGSIFPIELMIYLLLGAALCVLILLTPGRDPEAGAPQVLLVSMLLSVGWYALYLGSMTFWPRVGCLFQIAALALTSGVVLAFIIPGDIIRRIAFLFYTGYKPVTVCFGEPLQKEASK